MKALGLGGVGVEVERRGHGRMDEDERQPRARRPRRRESRAAPPRRAARAARREHRTGRRRGRAPRRLRRIRRGRLPGRPVVAEVDQVQARTTPTRARSRCSSRAPTGCRSAATTRAATVRARPGRACATSVSWSTSSGWSRRRSPASAGWRASSWSRSFRPRTPGATATSSSTRSARRRRRPRWCSASTPAAAGSGSRTRATACSPPSRTTRRATWCATGARTEGLSAYDRRESAGFLRNLVVREGRRTGDLQLRLVTSPGDFRAEALAAAVTRAASREAALLWTRIDTRRGGVARAAATAIVTGPERITEELVRPALLASPPEAFFQTNTEMAERLYGLAVDYAALEGRERVYDLYCGIGTLSPVAGAARRRGVGRRHRRGGDRATPIANARAERDRERPLLRGRRARRRCGRSPRRAPRPDLIVVDPPRAGLSKKVVRADGRAAPAADRLRVVQPDDARPERGARWSPRATGSLRCGPSTCSPTPRTSSASRVLERRWLTGRPARGFGVAAGPRSRGRRASLPAAAPRYGYASLWSNDHPMASGLETAAVFAAAAPELGRRRRRAGARPPSPPRRRRQDRRGRPRARAGCGSASAPASPRRPLAIVRGGPGGDARRAPGGTRVAVAAMGPKMCRLAGARGGRRVPQLDDARARRLGARAHPRGRARVRPRASRRSCSATCASRSAPTPRAAAQGGVLLPRAAPGLHPPLRVARAPRRARSAWPRETRRRCRR